MTGKYDENPIYRLYEVLDWKFTDPEIESWDDLDNILKLILLNNGCKISTDNQYQSMHNINFDDYRVCFITGMLGNDANEYYDFLIFNGMKILVIFIDYFNIIKSGDIREDDSLYELKIVMGNSVYYDAIKKIVEIFYLTSEPMPGGLLTTTMATIQRWNQAIIAIHILNKFKPVDENDVSDIPMKDVKKILENNIQLQLYGIRTI